MRGRFALFRLYPDRRRVPVEKERNNRGEFTADYGDSWTRLPGLPISETDYKATATYKNHCFVCIYPGGIYHSADTGKTWVNIHQGLTDRDIDALLVNGNFLFAIANRGLGHSGLWRLQIGEL